MPIYPVVLTKSSKKVVYVSAPSKEDAQNTAYMYAFELWDEEKNDLMMEVGVEPYDEVMSADRGFTLTDLNQLRVKYGEPK